MSRVFNSFIIASTILLAFGGCRDADRKKIVGTWAIEKADTVMNRVNQSDEETTSEGEPYGAKMMLRFHSNGILETITQMGAVEQAKHGQWKMVSYDSESNTMALSCDLKMQTTDHEVEFLDESTIKLVPPNMAGLKMKLKFKRQ